jgi:hypothetical protein
MPHYVGDGCELLPPHSARSVAHAVALRREAKALRQATEEAKPRAADAPERRGEFRRFLDTLGLRSTGRHEARHPEGGRE